jgi:hypothetical protein
MVAGGAPTYAIDVNELYATSTAVTADSATFTTTETTMIEHTATLEDGRTYGIITTGNFGSSVAGDAVVARLRLDSDTGTQIQGGQVYCGTTSTVGFTIVMYAEYTATADGDQVFVLTGDRNSGTGNIKLEASTSSPAYISVRLIS